MGLSDVTTMSMANQLRIVARRERREAELYRTAAKQAFDCAQEASQRGGGEEERFCQASVGERLLHEASMCESTASHADERIKEGYSLPG